MTDIPFTASTKRQALRALNIRTRSVQIALNEAASAICHAQRVLERDYLKERTAIINTHEPPPAELHLIPGFSKESVDA
jgi:hypothetical protein